MPKKSFSPVLLVFLASIIQLISPGITTLLGQSVGSPNSDPLITPAGYAFIIWGVITFLAFFYGIYQILPKRDNRELHKDLSVHLIIIYLLFPLWLIAAAENWLLLTVLIFVGMFTQLTVAFQKVLHYDGKLPPIEKVVLLGQLAIYTGWTTVAIFANTASAIKYYGLSDAGTLGIIWQSFILIGALINSVYWLKKFDRNLIYGLTIIWAFTGVLIGLMAYDQTLILQFITGVAILVVLMYMLPIPRQYIERTT